MVDAVRAVDSANRLAEFNRDKALSKRQRLQKLEDSEKFAENLESQYFEDKADVNHAEHKEFSQYINKEVSLTSMKANLAEIDLNAVEQFMSKYAAELDVDIMLECFDDAKFNKKDVDKLLSDLESGEEEGSDEVLDNFFKSKQLGIAQIYLVLSYLFEKLRKSNKKRLLRLIKELLENVEQQNSSLLFEFFSLAQHPSVKGNLKLASQLANLSSGEVKLANIKQVLGFIKDTLNGEFDNLVSNCLRCRSQILKSLKLNQHNSFEDLAELGLYLKFEKNLIIVQSLHLKMKDFNKQMETNKLLEINKLLVDYHRSITGVINFAELGFISETGINNLVRQLGIEINLSQKPGFLNQLVLLFSGLPAALFNDANTQRQKVIDGIRSCSRQVLPKNETRKFDFIKPQKINIEYV